MKFSVLMSIYSKENPDYFTQALESIITQTVVPNEIVIVEDGPLTDRLYAIIEDYKEEYPRIIKVLKLRENGGLGLALNAGIEKCQYEYIARMDTDDISLPNRFEKQMTYIEQHPETDVIGSDVVEYDEDMVQIQSIKNVPQNHEDIYAYLKQRNPFNHMSVVYRKAAVLNAGSYEDCLFFEDYYLWCKLAKLNACFYNIPENLVKVRAGDAMFNRRGGLGYVRNVYNFQTKIYGMKLINSYEFIGNVAKRSLISIIPNRLRTLIYKRVLRSEG